MVVEYVSLDVVMQAPGHATEDTDGGFRYGGWTGPFMTEHRRYMSQLFQTEHGPNPHRRPHRRTNHRHRR